MYVRQGASPPCPPLGERIRVCGAHGVTHRAHLDTATGAPVSDPAGIEKHPETRRIGDRRSAVPVESRAVSRCARLPGVRRCRGARRCRSTAATKSGHYPPTGRCPDAAPAQPRHLTRQRQSTIKMSPPPAAITDGFWRVSMLNRQHQFSYCHLFEFCSILIQFPRTTNVCLGRLGGDCPGARVGARRMVRKRASRRGRA